MASSIAEIDHMSFLFCYLDLVYMTNLETFRDDDIFDSCMPAIFM